MKRLAEKSVLYTILLLSLLAGCSRDPEPISETRYIAPDKLFQALVENVRSNPQYEIIVDIDHSRLAAEAGSSMPPAHVLIWSDSKLEADILERVPLAAIDLPLRVLAYEDQDSHSAAVIANGFSYLVNRYALPDEVGIRDRYELPFSVL